MTVAAVLLAYAACAGTLGSRMLSRARWTARAPLAAWSVVAALGLAGLTLAVHATALGGGLSHLIGACVLRLRSEYATPGGATVAGLGLILAGAVLARTAVTATTHLRATGRQASRHAQTARLVGHPEPALGAVLVEHPEPAAYCVAGRYPTVVLTTGALQALDPGQLDAVLAHERAHLAGHHHRLRAMARIARQVLPFMPLMQDADTQVARLVELHADDTATRAHDPGLLATALVVLATAANPAPALATAGSSAPALAAAATDAVQRIHRLLGPAEPLAARHGRRDRAHPAAAGIRPRRAGARTGTGSSRLADPARPAQPRRAIGRMPALQPHAVLQLGRFPSGRAPSARSPPASGDEHSSGHLRVARYEHPSPERQARRAQRPGGPHDGHPRPTPPLLAATPQEPPARPTHASPRHRSRPDGGRRHAAGDRVSHRESRLTRVGGVGRAGSDPGGPGGPG